MARHHFLSVKIIRKVSFARLILSICFHTHMHPHPHILMHPHAHSSQQHQQTKKLASLMQLISYSCLGLSHDLIILASLALAKLFLTEQGLWILSLLYWSNSLYTAIMEKGDDFSEQLVLSRASPFWATVEIWKCKKRLCSLYTYKGLIQS